MPSLHRRRRLPRLLATTAALLAALAPTASAASTPDATWPGVDGVTGCELAAAGPTCRILAQPNTPADDAPAALQALGSPAAPEDDLASALDAMANARDAAAAGRARDEVLAILEGGELPGRVYSGIPLLNWNAPAKVKRVPAGGTVDVTEVRIPGHTLTDTWLLDFEAPDQPYAIRYHVNEVGGAFGGDLVPAPLLADGDSRTGRPAAAAALTTPALRTGTSDASRFTPGGLTGAGAPEESRLATQTVTVRMPAPGSTQAILSPGRANGASPAATLRPATPARLAAAREALGFAGAAPTPEERGAAIARLAPTAPERQIWNDVQALRPSDAGFLEAARTVGRQDRELVGAMRTREQVPPGVLTDPEADVTVVLQNNEAYVSRAKVRARGALRVQVVNRDGFAHRVEALALHNRQRVLGELDWGRFDWSPLRTDVLDPAGATRSYALELPDGAFALWIGDPDSGDQAGAVVELDGGPRTETLKLDPDPAAAPLHQAIDASGDHWVTLEGVDKVVRLSPGDTLAESRRLSVLLPGGAHSATSTRPPLGPSDVAVDARGIVWVTLGLGNAIARIDPALVQDGTTAGVRVYPLPPCGEEECAAPFPPVPGERPTREPLQMEVTEDARGNTLVWFTEAAVNAIGALRVAPDGTELAQSHFSCGCGVPLGIALAADGDVWFTEGVDNRLGRLTPGQAEPLSAASATLRHFLIPSGVPTREPELSPIEIVTSAPHSVAIDHRGLVWFTEPATAKLGYLDPEQAQPGTSRGIAEIDLPKTRFGTPASPADLAFDRAGTVYWTDEYGDAVGTVRTTGARDTWAPGPTLRPAARRSLTDSPLVDAAGDLWFLETAAGVITRVSGVTAGALGPARPPLVALDVRDDRIAVSGLREATGVDVRIERGRSTVAAAQAPVADGRAEIAAWADGAPGLRAGDRIRIALRGASGLADLVTTVPDVTAQAPAGGPLTGRAARGGAPLAGDVTVEWDGARVVPIDPVDGSFRVAVPAGVAAAPSSVSWTDATPAARWRVTVAVTRPAAPPAPAPPAQQPHTAEPVPGIEVVERPAPTTPSAAPAPAAPAPAVASRDCTGGRWLTGRRRAVRPALLGLTAAELRTCLGAPERRSGATWRYAGATLDLRGGRVSRMVITGERWTSERGGLRVGAARRAIAAALPGARHDRRVGADRAVLDLGAGRVADVRVTVGGPRRTVRRIEVVARSAAGLDRAGRPLLRSGR